MSKDDPEREARLAAALRANLRRRKAQDRERGAAALGDAPVPGRPAATDGTDGD